MSDFNNVNSTLRSVRTVDDLNRAESLVNEFASKDAGVVCDATKKDQNHIESVAATITVDTEVARWHQLIDAFKN